MKSLVDQVHAITDLITKSNEKVNFTQSREILTANDWDLDKSLKQLE